MKEVLTLRFVESETGEMEIDITPPNPSGAYLDVAIQLLGEQRQKAQPPVPDEMPFPLSEVPVSHMDRWMVASSFQHGNVLALRHSALGWLAYALPATFQAELVTNLERLAQQGAVAHPSSVQ